MPEDINDGTSVGTSPQTAGATQSGALSVAGAITYAGSLMHSAQAVLEKATQYTVSVTDAGYVITTGSASTNIVYTLPTRAAVAYTFMYTGTNGAASLSISQVGGDVFQGIGAAGVADKDLVLTAALARKGDYVRIHGGAATIWSIVEMRGAWTREA